MIRPLTVSVFIKTPLNNSFLGDSWVLQGWIAERQAMINRQHPLSMVAQFKLLGLSRARIYRLPTPPSAEKLDLMRRIDSPC